MAIYEYLCPECGPFSAMRPMSESATPAPCPGCAALSARAWITPPTFFGMSADRRLAHTTNERAQHEPRLASQSGSKHVHGPGCGCGSSKSKATFTAPSGEKSFPGKRPWMISH
jgi:putative FmdB family regulatory protein